MQFLQLGVVGDEEVDASGHGAGEVNGIGTFDLRCRAYVGESIRWRWIEVDDLTGAYNPPLEICRILRAGLIDSFDLYLAESQRGGDDVILLQQHSLAKTNDRGLEDRVAFQEVDVMVGVPEEPRHLPFLAKVGHIFVRVLVGP
jgi:hypothetical protein